jgi:hypothetical protein
MKAARSAQSRTQRSGESVEQYYQGLTGLWNEVGGEPLPDFHRRQQFIEGLSEQIRVSVRAQRPATLAEAKEVADRYWYALEKDPQPSQTAAIEVELKNAVMMIQDLNRRLEQTQRPTYQPQPQRQQQWNNRPNNQFQRFPQRTRRPFPPPPQDDKCWWCNQSGHRKCECDKWKAAGRPPTSNRVFSQGQQGKGQPRR